MWKWLLEKTERIINTCFRINRNLITLERDDIVQEVMLKLNLDSETAKKIYNEKNTKLLFTIVRSEIYEAESKSNFSNKMELSRFQRILAVCDRYGISPVPENAYKISALIDKGKNQYEFSINSVANLLRYAVQCNPDIFKYKSSKERDK